MKYQGSVVVDAFAVWPFVVNKDHTTSPERARAFFFWRPRAHTSFYLAEHTLQIRTALTIASSLGSIPCNSTPRLI